MSTVFTRSPFLATVIACDTAFMVFALDQISKWLVTEVFLRPVALPDSVFLPFPYWFAAFGAERLPFASIEICPYFNLVMAWNEGISFSLFSGHGGILLPLLLLAIVIGFSVWMLRARPLFLKIALAFVVGGALGNLWDRARFGAVIDFLDVHYNDWHYPAFNVADSSIVLGIVAVVIYESFFRRTAP